MPRRLSQTTVDRLVAKVGDLRKLSARDGAPRGPGMNDAEKAFARTAAERHPTAAVHRHGWPDFLLVDDGRTFAVEVKKGVDGMRRSQVATFTALEAAGIAVFVWNPARPDRLTPWRSYQPPLRRKRIRRILGEEGDEGPRTREPRSDGSPGDPVNWHPRDPR